MLVSVANAKLTAIQIKKIQDVYTIGKTIVASDGMSFEKTLPSIMGQESSWGVNVIGDKYDNNGKLKSVYDSSLGNFQIKLSTAKLIIKEYPQLYKKYKYLIYDGNSVYIKFEKNKAKMDYYKSVMNNPKWIKRFKAKEDKAIKTMQWANRNFEKHRKIHNSLVSKAVKDTRLINKLLTNHKFGAELAGYYLLSMYENALKKGWSKPYKRSVGRYNGGWDNWIYSNKVLKRMKIINNLIKKGIID